MCNKIIKINAKSIGIVEKRQCEYPEFRDGLCKYHYYKMIESSKVWGLRKNYRSATQDDLNELRSLKLKSSNQNVLYRMRNGVIEVFSNKKNTWKISSVSPDYTLFCVKI